MRSRHVNCAMRFKGGPFKWTGGTGASSLSFPLKSKKSFFLSSYLKPCHTEWASQWLTSCHKPSVDDLSSVVSFNHDNADDHANVVNTYVVDTTSYGLLLSSSISLLTYRLRVDEVS